MAKTTQTTVDAFIPEVWSKITNDTREEILVLAPLMDRRFETEFAGSAYDTVHVNGVDNFSAADQFSAGGSVTYTAGTYLSQVDIAINRHFYKAFELQHDATVFSNVDQFAKLSDKAAYAVALELDTYLAGFPDAGTSGSGAVGTLGVKLEDDDIIEASRVLDAANVPRNDRFFYFSTDQDAEFKKEEVYRNADYQGAVGQFPGEANRGFVANIRGFGWYTSTNVEGSTAAGHDNAFFHREWVALNQVDNMRVEGPTYDIDEDSDKYVVHHYYGAKEMRPDHLVWGKGA